MKHFHRCLVLCALGLFAPFYLFARTIAGVVVDSQGEPVVGATVLVQGTSVGTITDVDGKFVIDAKDGAKLLISYVGYRSHTESVSARTTSVRVALEEDTEVLEDVVVVGYGTQRRSDVTGSISSVKADEVVDFSSKSLAESLSGLAAGVQVTKGSGAPGEAADIMIRGAGSLNGMAPLYVVDGVAQEAGFNFNMRDVESIEILKDAGSAAIYGSKAAGGVILITTKQAHSERTQVDLNIRAGWRNIDSKIKLLNTQDWVSARDAFGIGSTLDVLGVKSVDDLPDTDWMGVMYGTGVEQEYNLSVSGGNQKTKFFLSLSFLDEKGTYMDTRATRYSFRGKVDHTMNKYVTFGASTYASMTSTNPSTNSSIYNHTIPFRTVPVATVFDEDGNYAQTPMSVGSGPNFAGMEAAYHDIDVRNYSFQAQAYLNVEFIKGLNWRTTGNANLGAYSGRYFTEYRDFGPVQMGVDGGRLDSKAGTNFKMMFNSVLTYDNRWGDHGFKAMVGTEWWHLSGYDLSVSSYGFAIPVAQSIALASAGPTKDASDGVPQERRGSVFARVNYDYAGRYLLAVNFRADASDRFARKNRWGFFPSVNVGWRISEEPWVKEPTESWLSNMKVRASWGILGNDNIPQYMYKSTYSMQGISHAFDNSSVGQTGAWIAILGNESLKWEEVNQVDVGLDLGFFKNRLTLTYDYYNRQTRDMLYRGSLNLTSGMSYYFNSDDPANTVPVYFNAGMVENQGHEVTINWQDKTSTGFGYSIGLNMSFNQNKVKQVGDKPGATTIDRGLDASWSLLSRTQDGLAMSMYYGYGCKGIFQNQEQLDAYNQYALDCWRAQNPDHPYGYAPNGQPLNADGKEIGIYYQQQNTGVGDLIYDDNGLGRVTAASRRYIGNPWPKMILGLNVGMNYFGFDLNLVFQGAFGFDIMNLMTPYTHMFMSDNTTAAIFGTSCFGKDNTTVTGSPRVGYVNEKGSFIGDGAANRNYSTVSGYLVEKGDYFKLKNLSFGYTLPQKYSRRAKMEKLRLYFSMQNVFTITKYSGLDPEIGGGSLMYNIDHQNRYLPSRLYSFGLDVTF